MGRQIIELVQVLVDRIEKNGYQQRAREDDIADVYKRLNEAEGQAKHWKAARDTAIEGGELLLKSNQSLQAEIETLRQQLAEAHAPAMAQQSEEIAYLRARLDEERSVIASLQQQLAEAQQQDVDAMRAFVGKVRAARVCYEWPQSWKQVQAALAELDDKPATVAKTAEGGT